MMIRNTLLALAATLALGTAEAASYNFNGQIETGPALGQTFNGQFSFDETLLTGSAYELLDLGSWTLNALGQTYTAAGATVAPQAAFWDGQFVGISAFHRTAVGSVSLIDGYFDLSSAYLSYVTPLGDGIGSYTVSAVPEPSTWALGLAGLAVIGVMARRRRQQA
ncbi:PEP-CTERM sorting domain-containing protein [Roseateles sp. GG27B]